MATTTSSDDSVFFVEAEYRPGKWYRVTVPLERKDAEEWMGYQDKNGTKYRVAEYRRISPQDAVSDLSTD